MPKNVICKKCNNLINGWCEKKIDSPDPNMVRDCQYFWEKTNADRIRAMNDEELEELLQDAYNAGSDDAEAWHFGEGHRYSFEWDLKWLQSPAEREGE